MSENGLSVDLFNAMTQQAVKAAGVDVANRVAVRDLAATGLSGKVIVISENGSHEIVTKPDPQRKHILGSVGDVVGFVRSEIFAEPVVWISDVRIVVTDDGNRLRGDFAEYRLDCTDLYKTVTGLDNGDGYTQGEFLNLLRVQLARAFAVEDHRLALISKVRNIIKREQSQIGKGSGSYEVGTVNAQNQAVEWDDSFNLKTTVIDDPAFSKVTYPVEVILDNRPETRQSFILSPVQADITFAVDESLKSIKELLTEELPNTHVFLGSPS